MPLFKSDEHKAEEAAAVAAVRAMSVPELAVEVFEKVFASGEEMSASRAFGIYTRARGVDLEKEDRPLFAEALQHLEHHRVIVLLGWPSTGGTSLTYTLTRRGRELLQNGGHRSVLAE